MSQRRIVRYIGRVQGVSFRATAEWLASRQVVTGFVRNLPNGDVELVAEGNSGEIDAFLETIRSKMGKYIQREEAQTLAATGEFATFSAIR